MDEIFFKKAKLYTGQILLYLVDINKAYISIFDTRQIYRIPFKAYDDFREKNKEKFTQEIYRLRQQRFIKKYFDGKNQYLELTIKGKKLLKKYLIQNLEIRIPKKWDKKWRIVIFDIPNMKKGARETFRTKLLSLGFIELQESVYVFPFECLKEIHFLKNLYFLKPHIQYIVAERIETEINLIKRFINRGFLNEKML